MVNNVPKVGILAACVTISSIFAQNSAVQFWDTTGTKPTAKFGWTGDPQSGKFYVQTPTEGEVLSIQGGKVSGTFTGDGSALTGVSKPADVTALQGSLSSFATKGKVDTLQNALTNYYTKSRVDTLLNGKVNVGSTSGGITSVTATGGLAGGGSTASVTVSVANGGIDSTKLGSNSVSAPKIVDGAVTATKISSSAFGSAAGQIAAGNHTHAGMGTITGVTAGTGLSGGGATGAVTVSANLTASGGDNGIASTIARGDHVHDGRYYTKANSDSLTGIAFGSLEPATGQNWPVTSAQSFCSVTLKAPAAGFVVVSAVSHLQPADDNYCAVVMNVSTTAGIVDNNLDYSEHWGSNQKWVHRTVSISRVFAVAAGNNTFYLNLKAATGTPGLLRADMNALYIKTQLGL